MDRKLVSNIDEYRHQVWYNSTNQPSKVGNSMDRELVSIIDEYGHHVWSISPNYPS